MAQRVSMCVLALALLFMAPSLASAQSKKGDKEVLLFGTISGQRSDSGTSTFGFIFANVGVFTSDSVEIGGGPSISFSGGGGGGTDSTVGGNGFFRKSFKGGNPKVVSYAGAEVNVFDFSAAADTAFVQLIAGLKNYLSEKAALDVKSFVGVRLKNPGDGQSFGVTVGLSILF